MALNSGTCLGAYEITAQIGAGGMGEVYRAWDPRLAREVWSRGGKRLAVSRSMTTNDIVLFKGLN